MKSFTHKGFTLLEVLVALAIFGMLLGGVLAILQQENLLARHTANLLRARLLANETMETLKVKPFEELKNASFTEVSRIGDMSVDIQISDYTSSSLKKVEVIVRWVDAQNRERKYLLSTLRSQYAPETIQ